MDYEIPEPPPIDPDDTSKAGLSAWTRRWETYRKHLLEHLVDLLQRHDDARELVARLEQYCTAVEPEDEKGRQWKRAVVARGPDEFTVRHSDDSLERQVFTRRVDGTWELAPENTQTADQIAEVPKTLLAGLFWWGDLTAIYKAKSYRGTASFIPPEECNDWW